MWQPSRNLLAVRPVLMAYAGWISLAGIGCQSMDTGGTGGTGGATCESPPAPAATVSDTVSFSGQIQPIFDVNCTFCHKTGGISPAAEALLKLTSDVSFASLVDQASAQAPAIKRVQPGDANASLLFLKVSMDNPPVGVRMPQCDALAPIEPLTAAEIGLIRDWINQGALNN